MTFPNMVRQKLRESKVVGQNEMHSLEQGCLCRPGGGWWAGAGRESGYYLQAWCREGRVILAHLALYRKSGKEIVSLQKLEMFDILAARLVMRGHLPANL